MQWGQTWRATSFGRWEEEWGNYLLMAGSLMVLYLSKRDMSHRPWRFTSRFRQSPVAAEQEYRLSPLIGLAMGVLFGCVGILSTGLQFFGFVSALLICAGVIGAASVLGWWWRK